MDSPQEMDRTEVVEAGKGVQPGVRSGRLASNRGAGGPSEAADEAIELQGVPYEQALRFLQKSSTDEKGTAHVKASKLRAETRAERFQRLRREVQQLVEEMEGEASGGEGADSTAAPPDGSVDLGAISQELKVLQESLQRVSSGEAAKSLVGGDALVQALHRMLSASPPPPAATSAEGTLAGLGPLGFDFFLAPDTQDGVDREFAALEKKITHLERVVGIHEPAYSSSRRGASILATLTHLASQAEILDGDRLLELSTQAQKLSADIQEIKKEQESLPLRSGPLSTAEEHKIHKIFETVETWEHVAAELPVVVDRLASLKTLHNRSLGAVQGAEEMARQQAAIQDSLQSNAALLEQVRNSFAENMAAFRENVQLLQSRMDRLTGGPPR